MNKKLPNVFVNKIDKKIRNNEEVYYSDKDDKNELEEGKEVNIRHKFSELYKDVPFLYKKKVLITTNEGVIETKIISYNQNYAITIDNVRFHLDDIKDINFVE